MDVEYILGCALELGELTALEETVLRRNPGAYAKLDHAIRTEFAWPDHFLQNTARDALNAASQQERYFLALCSLGPLRWALKAMTERAEHLVRSRLQADLGIGMPSPLQLFPELGQPRDTPVIKDESEIGEGLVGDMLSELFAPMGLRTLEDLDLVQEAVGWFRLDAGAKFAQMLEGTMLPMPQAVSAGDLVQLSVAQAARARKAQKAKHTLASTAKSAIKKATKLFLNLGQEENLKLFVSGGEVVLSNPASRFKLVVKPLQVAGWLIDRTHNGRTHTPYELSLLTKDDVFLAKLCVYFQETPVLDQLLALTFYMQSGDELAILEKANWYATSQWTDEKSAIVRAAYPQLESKIPRKLTEEDPQARERRVREMVPAAIRQADAHWEPFRGRVEAWIATWFEPIVAPALALEADMAQVQRLLHQERRAANALELVELAA